MKVRATWNMWLLSLVLVGFSDTASTASSGDDAAIRQLQIAQAGAWNRHDAAAYAALFAEDGDCVNVLGWWWKGRAEIEKQLAAAFASVFQESQLTVTETSIRLLTPAIPIAHVRWTMRGAKTPPRMPEPKEGIQTQVLRKISGQWLIQGFQNTNGVPEWPFPAGPPARQ